MPLVAPFFRHMRMPIPTFNFLFPCPYGQIVPHVYDMKFVILGLQQLRQFKRNPIRKYLRPIRIMNQNHVRMIVDNLSQMFSGSLNQSLHIDRALGKWIKISFNANILPAIHNSL